MAKPINIIDLFAGPGGLGEGFSSLKLNGKPVFKIRMSVEKEASAHKTLTLRALYRLLNSKKDKAIYNQYVVGNVSHETLVENALHEWEAANAETLGKPTTLGPDNHAIHKKLLDLKAAHKNEPWIVIGGPPCQAYSLVGRARNKGIEGYKAENDHRHFLYQEYLEVLNIIQPDAFVMENVKGILTAQVEGDRLFPRICQDLKHPTAAVNRKYTTKGKKYRIYSFVAAPDEQTLFDSGYLSDSSFIIRAELFGIPQARHRVILFGISDELACEPAQLKMNSQVNIEDVISDLPLLRSKLSKEIDSPDAWSSSIVEQARKVYAEAKGDKRLNETAARMMLAAKSLQRDAPTEAIGCKSTKPQKTNILRDLQNWIVDDGPDFVLNHESRGHIATDLGRYLFSSCWAEAHSGTDSEVPKASDFPTSLRPNHSNWESGHFADRFRVQAKGRPATTITSHISKDGHYYIHFDARQCRSLTVREAARIQTFPDNYYFEGNRTQQYVQVGNAVPPFLATQIAEAVYSLISGAVLQRINDMAASY
jgi:DNA (cytosine-5)-methyltransferase 1